MIDKLAELRGAHGARGSSAAPSAAEEPLLPEQDPTAQNIMNMMRKFTDNLERVEGNNVILDKLVQNLQKTTTAEADKLVSVAIKKIVLNNKEFFQENVGVLSVLRTLSKAKSEKVSEEHRQLIDVSYSALIAKNKQLIALTEKKQRECQRAIKARLKTQLKAINSKLTEAEIDEVVNDEKRAKQIVQAELLGPAHLKIINYVEDINEKYRDIELLEKNVDALHELIQQMAQLVDEQGEAIGRISHNVGQTQEQTEKGHKDLVKAKDITSKTTRNKCIFVLLIVGLLAIVGLPVLLSVLNARNIL